MPRKKAAAVPDCFAVLGISLSAPKREAKKAYMKLSLEAHPDKGGDEERMKVVNVQSCTYEARSS